MIPYSIRPAAVADCPGIAAVQVDSYRSAYDRFFPPAYLEQFSYEEQTQDWVALLAQINDDILLVAVTPDHVVLGYVLARTKRNIYPGYDGEVVALHVRPPLKGQGAGRELMRCAVEALRAKGCTNVMLWTLQGNPIRAWYERLGGKLLGEKRDWWEDWEIVEVAYGWGINPFLTKITQTQSDS